MESASTLPDCDHTVSPTEPRRWDVFSVFISNPTRTVALWNQRAASSGDAAVIWDYHVVLALRERRETHGQTQGCWQGTWIYDLDTCLPIPCHWTVYVSQTFPLGTDMLPQYQRVIPGGIYLDNFASDRSHMLSVSPKDTQEEPRYLSEPPSYPVICGPEAEKRGIRNNLMSQFVSVIGDGQGFGTVMDFDGFTTWC